MALGSHSPAQQQRYNRTYMVAQCPCTSHRGRPWAMLLPTSIPHKDTDKKSSQDQQQLYNRTYMVAEGTRTSHHGRHRSMLLPTSIRHRAKDQ